MALGWEHTKRLMRLQGAAEELATALQAASTSRNMAAMNAPRRDLDALIAQVKAVLREADPAMAAEFGALVGSTDVSEYALYPKARAMLGWLKGAVVAEQFESQLREQAEAYARARLAKERPVGFGKAGEG